MCGRVGSGVGQTGDVHANGPLLSSMGAACSRNTLPVLLRALPLHCPPPPPSNYPIQKSKAQTALTDTRFT